MPRRRRTGFTLVELMLALTLTAIAAAVAGTTMVAARRTGERVDAHIAVSGADVRLRGMLMEMLRHAPAGERASEPLLQIQRNAEGTVLEFLTTGVHAPYGAGAVWRATLWEDSTGLRLQAVPVRDDVISPAIAMHVPKGAALDIEVLEPTRGGERAAWRADWPVAQTRPAAVRLTWRQDGTPGEPLVVVLSPLATDGSGQ
jgi:prepilin-type N-terminal cleavage/methylation domain-containing protein